MEARAGDWSLGGDGRDDGGDVGGFGWAAGGVGGGVGGGGWGGEGWGEEAVRGVLAGGVNEMEGRDLVRRGGNGEGIEGIEGIDV